MRIIATRRFPPWTGVVLLLATALLFGQFLAFIALGSTALMRPPALASPAPSPGSPRLADRH